MDLEEVKRLMLSTFPPALLEALVRALRRGYDHAGNNFDEERGSNNCTYGTDVYHKNWFELKGLMARPVGANLELVTFPAVRFRLGPFHLASHRVGGLSSDPISQCFPRSRVAGMELRSKQLPLFPHLHPSSEEFCAVLAHTGNAEDGLCAAYLCLPEALNHRGQIERWAHTEFLFKRSVGEPHADPIQVTLPEPEAAIKPQVTRKRTKREAT